MNKYILFIILLTTLTSCTLQKKVDRSLIIPGQSAEGYTIKEKISRDIINTSKTKELFSDILKVKSSIKIYFNQYSFQRNNILLLNDSKVQAIIITETSNHVTNDAVEISKGKDNFILNYGNKDLLTIKNKNNYIYSYPNAGILIADDKNDNSIDLLIIFKPQK